MNVLIPHLWYLILCFLMFVFLPLKTQMDHYCLSTLISYLDNSTVLILIYIIIYCIPLHWSHANMNIVPNYGTSAKGMDSCTIIVTGYLLLNWEKKNWFKFPFWDYHLYICVYFPGGCGIAVQAWIGLSSLRALSRN